MDEARGEGRKEGRLENLMPSPSADRPSVARPSVVTAARDVFNEEGNRGRGGEYVHNRDRCSERLKTRLHGFTDQEHLHYPLKTRFLAGPASPV